MKKIALILISFLITLNSFSQEAFDEFTSDGVFRMPFFGGVCKNITIESSLFKCSQDQIKEYLAKLKTPQIVEDKKMKVTVIIGFKLDKNGKVIDAGVKKSSKFKEIDALCLKHINDMPNWNPEISNDMIVESGNLNLSFHFKYTKEK